MNVTAAYKVEEASQVSEPRRAVGMLAERLGFSESRKGRAALVVTELATNLAKHAKLGEMVLRPISGDGAAPGGPSIEVLAIDRGPGIPDVALSREDGHSTAGSLGHGLGAIERQSDFWQIYTQPTGTVTLARIWREAPPAAAQSSRYEVGAVQVSHSGEEVCGDDWDFRVRDDRLAIMVADGLGHGLSAHGAALEATSAFRRLHEETPRRIIEEVHGGLRATRGAAVAVLAIDRERRTARYCGVGNVSTVVVHPDGSRHSMVSQNGTAGHTAPRIQEFNYPLPAGSIVVMTTDGLGTQWDLAAYPGLRGRHPSVIAAVLYRDFSRRRDDVTVVVAKER